MCLLVSVLRSINNHIPCKYRCLNKRYVQFPHIYLLFWLQWYACQPNHKEAYVMYLMWRGGKIDILKLWFSFQIATCLDNKHTISARWLTDPNRKRSQVLFKNIGIYTNISVIVRVKSPFLLKRLYGSLQLWWLVNLEYKFWTLRPTIFQHIFLWCSFLDPHLNEHWTLIYVHPI